MGEKIKHPRGNLSFFCGMGLFLFFPSLLFANPLPVPLSMFLLRPASSDSLFSIWTEIVLISLLIEAFLLWFLIRRNGITIRSFPLKWFLFNTGTYVLSLKLYVMIEPLVPDRYILWVNDPTIPYEGFTVIFEAIILYYFARRALTAGVSGATPELSPNTNSNRPDSNLSFFRCCFYSLIGNATSFFVGVLLYEHYFSIRGWD